MKSKVFAIFVIISLILVIPLASAQEINIAGKAKQKSVEVTISESGDVHVKHIVSSSNSPKQVELVDGIVENLVITDEEGEEKMASVIGNNNAMLILPSQDDSIIEYDLEDVLLFRDGYWVLEFLYLESTAFLIPEKLDLVFVNEKPVMLGEKKGFMCHGCQMVLEYSFDEPKILQNVKWEDKEFDVEIMTHAELKKFTFDQSEKSITLEVIGKDEYVTVIVPLELLWEPYTGFLGEQRITLHKIMSNGTHVGLNMKIDDSGEIIIIGTTVVPEFPIIAPLAIGLMGILIVPFLKRFNLH